MSGVMSQEDQLAYFQDPDASSVITAAAQQITAPMVKGAAVTNEEMMMGGGLRVVMYVFDRSPSMEDVGDLLLEGCSEDLVPAIKEAREDDISVLRIGGLSFSSDITQIWGNKSGNETIYFHKLDELPSLTKNEYDPEKGWGTALHAAILKAYAIALAYANQEKARTGQMPEIDIVILSDGANNDDPRDPGPVQQVITGSKKDLVRFVFFYFETDYGLKDPKGYGLELGFDGENIEAFMKKPGETAAERKSRFRRMMRVMSKVSASKGTSAVQAAAAVPVVADDDDDEDLM